MWITLLFVKEGALTHKTCLLCCHCGCVVVVVGCGTCTDRPSPAGFLACTAPRCIWATPRCWACSTCAGRTTGTPRKCSRGSCPCSGPAESRRRQWSWPAGELRHTLYLLPHCRHIPALSLLTSFCHSLSCVCFIAVLDAWQAKFLHHSRPWIHACAGHKERRVGQ